MIKVLVKQNNNQIVNLSITGHADSGEYGKDLVCAGVSTASTILFTLKILFAEPTDVPPNFITFISFITIDKVDTMCRKQDVYTCIDLN